MAHWLVAVSTMATFKSINHIMLLLLLLSCFHVFPGFEVFGLSYDYSFTPECLENPLKPQYRGGIVANPEFSEGLKGWSAFGGAKLEQRESKDGNKFIVALDRSELYHSLSQKFDLDKEMLYVISAWLRVSNGESQLAAIFKTSTGGFQHAGSVIARSGCWSMLKGGLVVNASGPAELYFNSDNPNIEIWADSISLQPITKDEWKSHQDQSLEKTRKSKVSIKAVDPEGRPLANAKVSVKQLRNNFPFGVAINSNILSNQAYQNWFTSRPFRVTVFENEFKWFSTEKYPGREDYSTADALLRFAKQHNLQVRGHNVFWDDPSFNPSWVVGLSGNALLAAANRRINSVVRRYAGQLIHWDVVNENLHKSFFESKLGANISAVFYRQTNQIDSRATPFLNEFNTIEQIGDQTASPAKYLQKISQIRQQGYGGPLGIGLEGHFDDPNLAFVRTAIDTLASAKLPIWVTELDVSSRPNQAWDLDQIIREVTAHPAVNGLLIWSAWSPQGCYRMCLTDNNFKNLPTGDVVDKITKQFTHQGLIGTTDINGHYETSLFHGDYEVEISHPSAISSSMTRRFKVTSTTKQKVLNFRP